MRQITDHIVPGDPNGQLAIHVTDKPGAGGANHRYEITGLATDTNRSEFGRMTDGGLLKSSSRETILFQNGPIKEFGVNGVTQEALLAIVIDRLHGFQVGDFKCPENARALYHCEQALQALQARTRNRIARGVEGTTAP